MRIAFTKMEGAGNDYIYVDAVHRPDLLAVGAGAAAGLTPTAYCHLAAIGAQIEAPPSRVARSTAPADIAQVVALNRVGVNLNQIARALNSGVGLVPAELDATLERVNTLLDDWQEIA